MKLDEDDLELSIITVERESGDFEHQSHEFLADAFEVSPDGHLRIFRFGRGSLDEDWDEGTIAIFSPGSWTWVSNLTLLRTTDPDG